MKIVHYMSRFRLEDGGVVRAVLDICSLLARNNNEVKIITWDSQDIPESWKNGEKNTPQIVDIANPAKFGLFHAASTMKIIAEALKGVDVLHLHTPWETTNIQLSKLAREMKVPYILTVHGMLDDWSMTQRGWKKKLYLLLGGRKMLERAAFVHCTAQGELDQAGRYFPRGRGIVVPLVFDLDPFQNLPGPEMAVANIPEADTDDPVILFLSRVHYKKQPEALIDAAAILRDKGKSIRVLFAGTGEDDYIEGLRNRIENKNLKDQVFFLGMVVCDQKLSLYERADIFAMITSQENFGLVYAEALACRTPVIATKGTDIWKELEDSGGAVIVDGNAQATADAIVELLSDTSRLKTMGESGRKWVFDELDGEKIVARFEEVYQNCKAD